MMTNYFEKLRKELEAESMISRDDEILMFVNNMRKIKDEVRDACLEHYLYLCKRR